MSEGKRIKLLEKQYARIPKIQCKGLCHEACGPIAATELEVKRVEELAGKKLDLTMDLTCSLLTADKKCAGYANRPLVCRIFGASKHLRCPHGCEPERFLTESEEVDILKEVTRIDGPPTSVLTIEQMDNFLKKEGP